MYRYRTGKANAQGKPERRSMGLGMLAVVDLKQARKLALEAASKRNAGVDPLDDKREKRKADGDRLHADLPRRGGELRRSQ